MVICTVVDELIKKLKKERSMKNDAISKLYTSTKQLRIVKLSVGKYAFKYITK